MEVEQQIIGKDEKSVYNFSTPEMSESETEQLFLQADISKINLSNTMDLYEEKEEQTENSREDATQVTEETSILDSSVEESETSATREVSEESWTSETSSEVTQEQSVTEKKTDDSKAENKKTTEKESKSELRNMPLPLEPSRLRQNNSMFAQSIPLQLNQSSSGNISLIGEKKYYQFKVPERQAGTIYDKYTMYTTSNFDSYGTLYDSEGKVIESNDDGNGNRDFKIIKEDLQSGIYYLEVRELSNTRTGSYVVRVDRELGQDENYDHGTAVPLPINKDYSEGIDFKGDKDYYRIEVPECQAGTIYDKYIMYATGDFDNYGTLYTSEGEVVASDDDSNGNRNFKITKENLRPGIYYLEVKGYADSKVGSYSVRIDTEETLKQKPIRINSTGSYSGSIGATDKEQIKRYEFFVWDKPQGTVFREHEFSFKSDLFGTMTLLDENQKTITTLNHNGQALDSKILKELQAGKYYLEVKTQGNFSFKINEQNISNDSNRNFKEAKLLIKNQKITDTIDFGEVSKYAGDEDYFKIFIPSYEHGKYNIQLSGDTEVIGQLYNDQEESISGDFKNTLTKKLTPGIYYVKVRGKNANVRGSYQVSFTGEDAFEDAINLPLNETMQDDLSDVKGAQYYKFQVSDVQKLEFYLANSAPTTIEVYDQNHKKMIGKTWETTNHKVSGTFLPGMYYIKIASKSATKYKLLIDTVQRNENQIELVQVGMSMQVHLNGVASPELTQFFYKRFGARSLLLPGSFSVLDFMKGLVTEWTINTGGVQILDALFGTDRTGYLKDWQGKSKEYVLGLYVRDAISLVQGVVTLVGEGHHWDPDLIEWTNHGYKHYPPKNMKWKDIVSSTKNGPAKYKEGINIEQLERKVWKEGKNVSNGKPWKVMEFDDIIGASSGKETRFMRVEKSSNTIHGHPITELEFNKLIGK
ncbi:hypothetical protein JZO86_07115 [Enterococcus ureasiticus]|uniref:hypothetical protein n=1 Tax=Enterococcus ureasiticus TaxID=903984 RepID=UPI001A904FE8|nr:hypothetical protein [Enterococcus ureasiticus]MBO0473472.1 hypothetical protein [Enterococcus ureasiticus]